MNPHKLLEPVRHDESELEIVEISTDQFESILNIQQRILDGIAQDYEEHDILSQLCTLAEQLLPDSSAFVMLLDEKTSNLNLLCAPSLDSVNHDRLNGIEPGLCNGTCAAAVYFGKPAYAVNTFIDPVWKNNRDLVNDFNICSSWSMPVKNRDGRVIGTFALASFEHRSPTNFHDRLLKMCASAVSILLERKKLRKQAMIDKLTKLWNRTKLDSTLSEHREKMSDPDYGYAVMLIDIDLFKSVNDNYGHNVGDSVLVELAEVLRSQIGTDGLVGRWGGEEFMVILTKPSSNQAPEIAQQLRQTIQDHNFKTIGTVTVSIGVCVVAQKTRTLEIIDMADRALYQAKDLGRNRVSVHYKNKPKTWSLDSLLDPTAISA
jgi:diguanylate cyclase (GGDEF)-like protein